MVRVVDVGHDSSCTHFSCRIIEIRSSPQRGQLAQVGELLPEQPGRTPLHGLDYLMNGDLRPMLYQDVNVVRGYLQCFEQPLIFPGYLVEYCGKSKLNVANQNLLPPLWNPDQVNMGKPYRVVAVAIVDRLIPHCRRLPMCLQI